MFYGSSRLEVPWGRFVSENIKKFVKGLVNWGLLPWNKTVDIITFSKVGRFL